MFRSLGLQQVQKVKVGPGGWLVNCEQASYPSHGQPLIHVPKLFFNLAVSDVSVLPDLSSYHRNVMLFLPMANRSWTVLNSEAVRHFSSVVVNNRPSFCVFWHPAVHARLLTHLNKATRKFTFAILPVQKPVVFNSWVWFSSQGVIWKMAVLAKMWQMFFFFLTSHWKNKED